MRPSALPQPQHVINIKFVHFSLIQRDHHHECDLFGSSHSSGKSASRACMLPWWEFVYIVTPSCPDFDWLSAVELTVILPAF